MFSRKELDILYKRISEPKKFIQIITGPRQVGKTTLVEQLQKKFVNPQHYASADAVPASSMYWISQQWETARIKLRTSASGWALLVIDEIQKINNWSEAVKNEWDSDTRNGIELKVILLGSSALQIQKGLSESLTGRFEMIKLPHWSYIEMHEAFGYNPDDYIWFGAYPGAASLAGDENRWKNYILDSIIETTISKDILSLTNVHKPALLKNLFELASGYSGQILSYTKILGHLSDAGNTTTLAHYQALLDNIWFISGLNKYSASVTSSRISIPKWMVYNTAFLSVYSGLNFKSALENSQVWGRHVETAIGSYLLNDCKIKNRQLYYWRESNNEVDFVVADKGKIFSIEVKSGKYKSNIGIEKFTKKYKPAKTILVSSDSLSWQDFLSNNPDDIFGI